MVDAVTTEYERRVVLAGSWNFRDLGGYPTADGGTTKWRSLFRSDAVHRLTAEDLEIVRPLGLGSILDLRSRRELDESGSGLLHAEPEIRHRHIPFGSVGDQPDPRLITQPLSELYVHMLDDGREAVGQVFSLLADEASYPAVVHRAAGKDRTGITVALVLRSIGVDDETIVADYALTDGYILAWYEHQVADDSARYQDIPKHLIRAEAETMRNTLIHIDERFGSTAGYLREAGVDEATVASVKRNLVGR